MSLAALLEALDTSSRLLVSILLKSVPTWPAASWICSRLTSASLALSANSSTPETSICVDIPSGIPDNRSIRESSPDRTSSMSSVAFIPSSFSPIIPTPSIPAMDQKNSLIK